MWCSRCVASLRRRPRRRPSAFKAPVFEVLLLLRRRGAAEDRVAVRKATEAADEVAGLLCVFQVRAPRLAIELHAALLVDQILGVHERQEEEATQLIRHV